MVIKMLITLIVILIVLIWLILSSIVIQVIPKMASEMYKEDRECLTIFAAIFSPISIIGILGYYFILICMKQTKCIADHINQVMDKFK